MLYDISPSLHNGMATWPGDTPFTGVLRARMADGAPANVGTFSTTPHAGAHVDAPFHTEAGGVGAGELPLAPFLGPCRVVRVPAAALIEPQHLGEVDLARVPRLLLHTGSVADRRRFSPEFSAVSPELAALCARRGVLLLGIDTPSVDPYGSPTLAAHHALARGGVAILEGIVLDEVPAGVYELIALPLKIAGFDGAPVRAVLRPLDGVASGP